MELTLTLTNEQILQKVATGELSATAAAKLLKTTADSKKKVYYKVSTKGAISFYGLRRMPITLYIGELEQIIAKTALNTEWNNEFNEFITKVGNSITRKPEIGEPTVPL